ncbi:calcitonin receptor-like protein 1 [Hyalella azteca]|uniref:Calcitonin receptor-like protein 1 n=1 Tax=Hyalella azteca TaxID=294128 RepID=A0A8B7P8C3_HYAAZ|nr:calcitonin receptor-like protein 1 [Hyalella azteca]
MNRLSESFASQKDCLQHYHQLDVNATQFDGVRCRASYDGFLCWPPSPPALHRLPCPQIKGADPSKLQVNPVMDDLHSNSPEEAMFKIEIARTSRVIEMVGLVISMLAILTSIIIFCYFRSLRNNRTRMHLNLFGAMMIQITVRLTLYTDQYVTRDTPGQQGIDNTAMLCESFYILLEYARTAMFLWMFIEGHYLHSMLTITVFSDRPNFIFYYVLGWGLPVVMTAVWAAVTVTHHSTTQCMWGYSLSPYFWILEGPRLAIILTNLLFLLNILRVLITKLKASVSTETQQVKKAVRAAIVLLPLLGITNSLQMVSSLLDQRAWTFAAWSYFNTILTSFQGFFVALIYCFLNQEVRITLRKFSTNYSHSRSLFKSSRRFSMSTNVQSEAIPMTATVKAPVLAVICEDSSEKEATPVTVPLVSHTSDTQVNYESPGLFASRSFGNETSSSRPPETHAADLNDVRNPGVGAYQSVRYSNLKDGSEMISGSPRGEERQNNFDSVLNSKTNTEYDNTCINKEEYDSLDMTSTANHHHLYSFSDNDCQRLTGDAHPQPNILHNTHPVERNSEVSAERFTPAIRFSCDNFIDGTNINPLAQNNIARIDARKNDALFINPSVDSARNLTSILPVTSPISKFERSTRDLDCAPKYLGKQDFSRDALSEFPQRQQSDSAVNLMSTIELPDAPTKLRNQSQLERKDSDLLSHTSNVNSL